MMRMGSGSSRITARRDGEDGGSAPADQRHGAEQETAGGGGEQGIQLGQNLGALVMAFFGKRMVAELAGLQRGPQRIDVGGAVNAEQIRPTPFKREAPAERDGREIRVHQREQRIAVTARHLGGDQSKGLQGQIGELELQNIRCTRAWRHRAGIRRRLRRPRQSKCRRPTAA